LRLLLNSHHGGATVLDLGQALGLCAIPALCGAAVTDVRCRRVPNLSSALVALAGVAARAASGDVLPSLLLASAVFAVLYLLWRWDVLGGGDVKLLSACVLVVPTGTVAALLAAVTLSGGVLAMAYLLLRVVAPMPQSRLVLPRWSLRRLCRVEVWRIRRGGPLPYACAISAGCMFTLFAG
jgi:prepilin peptidase CpaA